MDSFPNDFRKVSNFNQLKSLISKWNGGGGEWGGEGGGGGEAAGLQM